MFIYLLHLYIYIYIIYIKVAFIFCCIYLFFFRLENYKIKSEIIEQELLECREKINKLIRNRHVSLRRMMTLKTITDVYLSREIARRRQ